MRRSVGSLVGYLSFDGFRVIFPHQSVVVDGHCGVQPLVREQKTSLLHANRVVDLVGQRLLCCTYFDGSCGVTVQASGNGLDQVLDRDLPGSSRNSL